MGTIEAADRLKTRSGRAVERARAARALAVVVLVVGAILLLIPFAWMVSTSLKPEDQIFLFPPRWIPRPFAWENYVRAWTAVPFAVYTRNTILITTLNILGNILGSSLAAFSFSRLRYPGRQTLFLIMLSTMMVPYWVTIVPTFILFRTLGWTNTFAPLVVPQFFAVPFYTFLLRQYFMGISSELEDAARIDGASTLRIYSQIVMPLAKPALATVAIFSFVYNWNDLINPLIYITDQRKYTVAVGLAGFRNAYRIRMSHMMAASTVAVLPVIIIYFFAQRLFIQGIMLSGSKG
jgi:ABC-type glycerol-3-phosphate transport system permease component